MGILLMLTCCNIRAFLALMLAFGNAAVYILDDESFVMVLFSMALEGMYKMYTTAASQTANVLSHEGDWLHHQHHPWTPQPARRKELEHKHVAAKEDMQSDGCISERLGDTCTVSVVDVAVVTVVVVCILPLCHGFTSH